VSYNWNFGDGTNEAGASPTHTYSNPGSCTAVLTVTDNLGATGTSSVTISVNSNTIVVNAPTNLTASANRTTVTLTWKDNSNNETGFYIERGVSGSASFSRIGSTGANVTNFTDSPGRGTWVYRVQAYNGTTLSAYSNTATARSK
jgi:thermitase